MPETGALVIYGNGADLGNFKFFADDLVTTELASYHEHIQIRNVTRRDDFFQLLLKPPLKIKELHIYSHSIGAGIYIGYGVQTLGEIRGNTINRFAKANLKTPYTEVLNAEQGGVLTDDLVRAPYAGFRDKIRSNFVADAKIKIWGCNSGVANWIYSDPVSNDSHDTTGDPNAPALYYYWRALNEINIPKPSIAQALADYFGVKTYGARSGSSIQVKYKGNWVSAPSFLKTTHRRSVGESDTLRLAPDGGDYYEYNPQ